MDLSALRLELDKTNTEIFKLLKKRKEIVSRIQAAKNIAWSPLRELDVFTEYLEKNPENGFYDHLIYSLLIESQAQGRGYPQWSRSAHLECTKEFSLFTIMNPILLRMINESEYRTLKLKKTYQSQIEELWQNQK